MPCAVPRPQPNHFGAASGMGLCYFELSKYEEALAAFEVALAIHPRMDSIERLAKDIRARLGK